MYSEVRGTIKKFDMLKQGDRVLVCVSGGPDSIYLLKALYHLKEELGIALAAANLDHGIRGMRSKRDSDFVKRVCHDHDINYFHERLKSAGRMNKKLSMEENLREARYDFFKKAAKKLKAGVIATGHTLDDNAETVLMRIIKGSSLKGLAGILPVRTFVKLKIIRPLIEMEKSQILGFLKDKGIGYRVDHTNLDETFLRNRIRRKLFPYLARYNPRIKFALTNMAESLREDLEFIEARLSPLRKGVVKGVRPVFSISLKDLVVQPKTVQRALIKDALTRSGANIKKLKFDHWKELREFLKFKRSGQSVDLPGDIRITRTPESIVFRPRSLILKNQRSS